MNPAAAMMSTGSTRTATAPTRGLQVANFIVFQAAWFAAVLGAAHHVPLWGATCVIAAIAWHLGVCARPRQEAILIALACAIGFVVESAVAMQGNVAYPSGQPVAGLAPYWMVALWGELAIALNVTMRWLKGRWWLASVLGAVGGPMAFSGGVALGGAVFIDKTAALLTLTGVYAAVMPLLVWLGTRFDGVVEPEPAHV